MRPALSAEDHASPTIQPPRANARRVLIDRTALNALDYLCLYRLFVALLLALLFLTPIAPAGMAEERQITARIVTLVYALTATLLLLTGRRWHRHLEAQIVIGLIFDLVGAAFIVWLLDGVRSGAGVLLMGTMGAAGVLLPLRLALTFAAIGTISVLYQTFVSVAAGGEDTDTLALGAMLGVSYFAIALLGSYLAQRTRETQAIAEQRGADLANLTELNTLILQRMRTGVGLINPDGELFLANHAAWYLAGMPEQHRAQLNTLTPALADEYVFWQNEQKHRNQPIALATSVPAVVPRFARFTDDPGGDVLVFLEDASMLPRRAQEMTLASLGRLSASIAHEIRNPLAAISHSAQLLGESDSLNSADAKLSNIIARQCSRLNDIIENVLQLARQESARPDEVNLLHWLPGFAEEFTRHQDAQLGSLELQINDDTPSAVFDPGQLQQVLWNLCQNAFKYGRRADEPARVTLATVIRNDAPAIEVRDQGEGIDQTQHERIFEPFFTSSDDGTGLGLYLCRQIAQANSAILSYHRAEDGGSVFRLTMAISRPETPLPTSNNVVAPIEEA